MPPSSELSFSEMQLLDEACDAFQRATRYYKAKPVRARTGQPGPRSGAIRFEVGGKLLDMQVLVRSRVPASYSLLARLHHGVGEGDERRRPLMLVAPYIGPKLAEKLIEQNAPFLDAAGNVFVNEPECMIMITGRPKSRVTLATPSARATTPKGMQVTFILATRPALVAQSYRAIADASGVALNTVNQVVDDLITRGLVATKRNGERILPDWVRLVQEWVNLYPSRLRAKLGTRRYSSASRDWWRSFDFAEFGARLGGEAAADILTHELKAANVTLYAQGAITSRFMLKARLRPDEHGDVEILDAFWPAQSATAWEAHDPPLVHPLLIYADLLASGDSRNASAAEQIYDKHLAQLQP
ncbi:type IV toxin-antitoxin system AbiEi family antitoxin [Trinickia mobilis]|uniref:type IV toxin-antitoxin system AbiEi family antitoxin n=1 Tax=Trinickia mobilis TaxID=2816356 RepID=UPI001A8EE1CF|nr:type IV toxin-antitoxin system AbiEi family antitoxin [Trinickia mobilis]